MSKGPGTLCYTWLSTPRATYIQDRDANEHRQANTLKDNPNQGKTGAPRDTPSTGGKPSGTHTPPRGSLGSTWGRGHAHRRREPGVGSSAAPAHLAPKASPQAPPVCVPVRACVRTRPRAPPPVGGEVRTAPGAARLARRGLPGGAVAMERRARQHTNGSARGAAPWPAWLPPPAPSSSFTEVTPARGPGPRPPLQRPEPWGTVRRPGSRTLAASTSREKAQAGGAKRCEGGARNWDDAGAARPGLGHQTDTAAGSAGAALEWGWLSWRGGK